MFVFIVLMLRTTHPYILWKKCSKLLKKHVYFPKEGSKNIIFKVVQVILSDYIFHIYIFFYLGFLSRTFTIHGTVGEGRGYFFKSPLPLLLASQTLLDISWAIAADSLPLHIASSRTQTRNLWFLSASR